MASKTWIVSRTRKYENTATTGKQITHKIQNRGGGEEGKREKVDKTVLKDETQ